MKKVLITGGTGLVGRALTAHLNGLGYGVIILSRKVPTRQPSGGLVQYAQWNVQAQTIDTKAVQEADYIVHLAGAGVVEKRWTAAYKKEIIDSRVHSSALLCKALQETPNKVKAVVSASAIGWYGADSLPVQSFVETDPADTAFLGNTCRLWEESTEPLAAMGKRLVKLRIGIVLSKEGGALVEFKKPLRMRIAAILGSGRQVVSWIDIADLCRLFTYALENENLQGVYNAVAPNPVSNKILTLTLARILTGRFFIPVHVPAAVLTLVMGGSSIEVLKSTTVSSAKITATGFTFTYDTIQKALEQ